MSMKSRKVELTAKQAVVIRMALGNALASSAIGGDFAGSHGTIRAMQNADDRIADAFGWRRDGR